ncbi:scavenger receptor cysteine-rich type 1 protein M130-like isoform X2 [Narcine bancroftii]|uniref:scavenger receptor cysteine-rich type 1 protein M130-like isoform X2 n=1 Tax=Narcine bancroftii TaxID=1343680 RepID=UPI0038321310
MAALPCVVLLSLGALTGMALDSGGSGRPRILVQRWNHLYLKAESPKVYCIGPRNAGGLHRLYEGVEGAPRLWATSEGEGGQATFILPPLNVSRDYRFWCALQASPEEEGMVNTTISEPVTVTVQDRPSRPMININPISGHFQQFREITCSVNRYYRVQIFYLKKDGCSLCIRPDLVRVQKTSATFRVANTRAENGGNYTCWYQVWSSGWSYNSTESKVVHLSTGDSMLRLVNGRDRCSGQVEIFYGGEWGRVLSEGWDLATADVLCHHLECGFGEALPNLGQGTGKIWLKGANCQGGEETFWECFLFPQRTATMWERNADAAVTCSKLPAKPTISLPRSPAIFVEGENFEMKCTAPNFYFEMNFYLGRVGGEVRHSRARAFSTMFAFTNVTSGDTGTYTCWYKIGRAGRCFNSTVSDRARLDVGDTPGKPELLQDTPQKVFLPGGSTVFRCVPPYLSWFSGYFLYRTDKQKAMWNKSGGLFGAFLAHVGDQSGRFNYMCAYQVRVRGRDFNSTVSSKLEISVVDQLSQPRLELLPSADTFAVNLTVSCLATNTFTGGTFSLHQEGREEPIERRRDARQLGRVTFGVSKARVGNQGNYTCRQSVEENGRWYVSPHSRRLALWIAEEVKLRLVGKESNCSGKVEVFYNSKWRKLWAPRWGLTSTSTVCRQLGCGFAASRLPVVSSRPGEGDVSLTGVKCSGKESSLWDCHLWSRDYRTPPHLRQLAVNCSDHPKSPGLVLNRPSGHYLEGEKIRFQCHAPTYFAGSRFYFYKDGRAAEVARIAGDEVLSQAAFTLTRASFGDTGSYTCAYQTERSGAVYNSTRSLSVDVNVTDQCPKPKLTKEGQSDRAFVSESVSVDCLVPDNFPSTHLFIEATWGGLSKTLPSHVTGKGARAILGHLDLGVIYALRCRYTTRLGRRMFRSPWSDVLKLEVTDRAPKPRARVTHLGDTHFQREVRIRCTAPKAYRGSVYNLHKEGQERVLHQPIPKRSYYTWFDIDNLDGANAGNYTCSYETELQGKKYRSELSDPVELNILGAQLRLVPDMGPCNGVVEMHYKGHWGPLCIHRRWTRPNAEVVCRQLNCGFSQPARGSPRGEAMGQPAPLSTIDCNGSEASLWKCSLTAAPRDYRCSPWQLAVVNCTENPEEPTIEMVRPVATGQSVGLRCTAQPIYATSRFYLEMVDRPSLWLTQTPPGADYSAMFTVPSLTGAYRCLYEVQRGGERYNSTRSRELRVSIGRENID